MKVFITGGARSGKSDFAERYAMRSAASGVYIATSQAWDDEMRERIGRHQEVRAASGFPWRTVEEPFELAAAIRRLDQEAAAVQGGARPAIVVDCLTLWLTNWLLRLEPLEEAEAVPPQGQSMEQNAEQNAELNTKQSADMLQSETPHNETSAAQPGRLELKDVIDDLIDAVSGCSSPLFLVTNEVGSGIVPAYALGRRFRDEAGRLNRGLAAACGEAYLVVAGFPLDLKAHAFRLEDA
ncbi:bifunctional adenosylcobinamide kinase/adenosylcobinamide-phosphate guanylyltransferase [Paenibacillus oenotherae]|uniref:Adenosylcobinamide kinase n=1 Tax=Paenibacillus oenotherae TaxID=1435645 RepID=A0ABS7CZZ8_9BACL|nr:bifunctional adenosylcobinamide kinase/adenosylcobinamide-phosphate guanylyltransferase [Paenibacillus oenotherae]MBW7473189.1 bifunctional adenosylcobinamide kinase/adenosylcobinamide-phosphate guanylyltransferase [Paenibacillus oenotherae]